MEAWTVDEMERGTEAAMVSTVEAEAGLDMDMVEATDRRSAMSIVSRRLVIARVFRLIYSLSVESQSPLSWLSGNQSPMVLEGNRLEIE